MPRLNDNPPGDSPRVLIVDLNNFARYPTLSVGLMAAVLRRDGIGVEVLSPLAVGMPGVPRPERAAPWGYWREVVAWQTATTSVPGIRRMRNAVRDVLRPGGGPTGRELISAFQTALERGADVVLVSAYLMYHEAVKRLAAVATSQQVPVIVGGPAFHTPDTRAEWLKIPGIHGLFAGECEPHLTRMVRAASRRESLTGVPGLSVPGVTDGGLAPPLHDLDELPFPDYSDFPWNRYPARIVSMMTARGCGWKACAFCSDVVSVNGRTFRSRSLEDVLGELAHHRDQHDTRLFCFSDLKLNSDLEVWRGLHREMQRVVPGASWTCAVHVGPRRDEGLGARDLKAARDSGLARITTGLESGSQRVLDAMNKGATLDRIARFLSQAHAVGISPRVTAFTGYCGEQPEDVRETAKFLRANGRCIDRVHLSRLQIHAGTPLEVQLLAGRKPTGGFEDLRPRPRDAEVDHYNPATQRRPYRRAIYELLGVVHDINRQPIRRVARELEGAM